MSDYPTMTAWVAVASPLTIKTAGAATAVPAATTADCGALTADDRVTIAVRTPQIPLVTGLDEAL